MSSKLRSKDCAQIMLLETHRNSELKSDAVGERDRPDDRPSFFTPPICLEFVFQKKKLCLAHVMLCTTLLTNILWTTVYKFIFFLILYMYMLYTKLHGCRGMEESSLPSRAIQTVSAFPCTIRGLMWSLMLNLFWRKLVPPKPRQYAHSITT